jgi:hypothetical protein
MRAETGEFFSRKATNANNIFGPGLVVLKCGIVATAVLWIWRRAIVEEKGCV